ncbi:hypothetical protein D917_02808 [Trichinella nativa]|uniref:Uncharacterized protein n=1 Tax=Trichinella nativa TaxID=6335 RepID=A0A1Y3EBS8_9BILA|nr:hypothetical protein D917_02808 [Trichinella nativa]
MNENAFSVNEILKSSTLKKVPFSESGFLMHKNTDMVNIVEFSNVFGAGTFSLVLVYLAFHLAISSVNSSWETVKRIAGLGLAVAQTETEPCLAPEVRVVFFRAGKHRTPCLLSTLTNCWTANTTL